MPLPDKGKQWLSDNWKLCYPLESDDDVANLKYWLETMYSNLGLVNYPYPANFLHDLPGNPVKVGHLMKMEDLESPSYIIFKLM